MQKHLAAMVGLLVLMGLGLAQPLVAQTPAPLTPTPKPTAPPAVARITSPVKDQVLRGTAEIQGAASLPNFSRYEVSYAQEARPGQWTLLFGDITPISDGTLAVWNTRVLSSTAYSVRLQVFGKDSTQLETIVRNVTVSNTVVGIAAAGAPADVTSNNPTAARPASAAASLRNINISLADVPRGFLLGAQYAAYAFGALFAYVLLKRIFWFAVSRRRRAINYGE